jgi:hypothetical protein
MVALELVVSTASIRRNVFCVLNSGLRLPLVDNGANLAVPLNASDLALEPLHAPPCCGKLVRIVKLALRRPFSAALL